MKVGAFFNIFLAGRSITGERYEMHIEIITSVAGILFHNKSKFTISLLNLNPNDIMLC